MAFQPGLCFKLSEILGLGILVDGVPVFLSCEFSLRQENEILCHYDTMFCIFHYCIVYVVNCFFVVCGSVVCLSREPNLT